MHNYRTVSVTVGQWAASGSTYNCSVWSPLASEVRQGTVFTQNRSCSQQQTRSLKYVFDGQEIRVINESQEINGVSESQSATGTLVANCYLYRSGTDRMICVLNDFICEAQ